MTNQQSLGEQAKAYVQQAVDNSPEDNEYKLKAANVLAILELAKQLENVQRNLNPLHQVTRR